MIKARWLLIPGLISIVFGFLFPYIMMLFFTPEVEASLWSWLAIISVFSAAASVYSYIGLVFIILGILLVIGSVIVFVLGRKKKK